MLNRAAKFPFLSIAATIEISISHFFQPFSHLGFARTDFVAVDGEALGNGGLGEGFLHVADAVGQAAAFVGGEGDDGLACEVDGILQNLQLLWVHP